MRKNVEISLSYATFVATTNFYEVTINVSLQKFLDQKYLQVWAFGNFYFSYGCSFLYEEKTFCIFTHLSYSKKTVN